MTIRTRFAPSPTGDLHVGSARTALYCWLYAKHLSGTFILRIEDTDLERSTQAAVDVILESMQWLGLDYDEGPFYQTKRFERYAEVAQRLLQENKAYRCYCSKERLEKLREDLMAAKQKPRYDGLCRNLSNHDLTQPHVIRFKNPQIGTVIFNDAIRGRVEIANEELDDLIIARTDGSPTYNFTVVVDDADMGIDIVIRGEDHIANTPRQINILQALGAKIPQYAHIPMILGDDGKRLSKRHGAVSVLQYRDDGYLPHALLNYLVRLGWSHGDQEIFSLDEMIQAFNLEHISKSAAAFNFEKLNWLNQHYLKNLPAEEIMPHLVYQLKRLNIDYSNGPDLREIIKSFSDRVKTTLEMAEKSRCFYSDELTLDSAAVAKYLTPDIKASLQDLLLRLTNLNIWQTTDLHQVITSVLEKFSLGMGKLAQPLRVAITGNITSPPIDITLKLVGKHRSLRRLTTAINLIKE